MGPPAPGPGRSRRHPDVGGRHGFRIPAGRHRGLETAGRARRLRLPGDPALVLRGRDRLAAAAARLGRRAGLAVHDPGHRAGPELHASGPSPGRATRSSSSRPVYHPFYYAIENNGRRVRPQSAPLRRPPVHDGPRRPAHQDRRPGPDAHPLQPPQSRPAASGRGRSSRPSAGSPSSATFSSSPTRSTTTSSTGAIAITSFAALVPGAGPADDHLHRPEQDLQHGRPDARPPSSSPNPDLHKKFEDEAERSGFDLGNALGIVAFEAAYAHGEDWLDELLPYLEANVDLLEQFLAERVPGDPAHPARGDLSGPPRLPRSRASSPAALNDFFLKKAGRLFQRRQDLRRRGGGLRPHQLRLPPGHAPARPWSGSSGPSGVKPKFL